jgi:uncharacterized RDD family membrane protein YckC
VVDRRDIASWMDGPPSAKERGLGYPGEQLGLPEQGPGSVARPGRRLVALAVDWIGCLLVSNGFFGGDPWATLGVFAALHVLTLGSIGASPGHALLGLRLRRLDGGWPGPLPAVVRTVLLCLVIPAVVYDRDQRGLHDRVARTVLVRR